MNRLFLSAIFVALCCVHSFAAKPNVMIWDTGEKLPEGWRPKDVNAWEAVPSDLMQLEKDPAKASSDPGYYGREYLFKGEAAVETKDSLAIFASASGKVLFFSGGKQVAELSLLKSSPIRKISVIRDTGDEAVLEVAYTAGGAPARFVFGKDEIFEIAPPARAGGIKIEATVAYAVAPSFIGDDLIFGRLDEAAATPLNIPSDHLLLGLLQGEDRELVLTWEDGKARARANLSKEKQSIEIENNDNDQSIFLALPTAPGIWHREALNSSFLEKDVPIAWKPPFAAKWQTQLSEGGVKATFAFHEAKGTIWRGVPGMYNYPVWFDGDKATFSLSKKVQPRGEAIIYCLEGRNTPRGILTPADMLKTTLGRAAAEPILDVTGRALRTHHGAAGSGVHRACTCGYTEAIQAVFEKGEETEKKAFIDQSINDMIYFVQRHLERIDEYRDFAKQLGTFIDAKAKAAPELKSYLDEIKPLVEQIPQEYENQKENMQSLEHANELYKKTMTLTGEKKADNLKAYMELLKAWRAMGGAQDYVVAQYHTLTRKLCQEAGYLAATEPNASALEAAQEIRARCKQILRNPDGYEIWANY